MLSVLLSLGSTRDSYGNSTASQSASVVARMTMTWDSDRGLGVNLNDVPPFIVPIAM